MVTANDLLKSLTNSEVEGHIVIGNDRHVIVPASLKRIAVQYDHNIETVTFDCPRYWDNIDMSKMSIYVNYMRSDGYADSYPVTNVTVDNNIMHFNWTISRNVTEVKGAITFLVCVKKTDAEGNEVNHWNSELCQDMFVSEGMETEEQISDLSSDLVTQLLLRMESVEQINIQASEMQNILSETTAEANRAEAARDLAVDAEGNIKNSYANAFKGGASGEILRVDDVSPIEHDVKCYVHGKNLFDVSKITNTNVATNNGNGSITIAANNYYCRLNQKLGHVCPHLKSGDVAVLSFNSNSSNTKYMYFHGLQRTWNVGEYITLTKEILDSYITIYGFADNDPLYGQECIISNIQIEKGTIATTYEPYIDPTSVTVSCHGKNMFPVTLGTYNGVTLSKQNDYYILNGTATGSGLFITKIGYLPAGTYTVSANNPNHNNLGHVFVPIVQLYSPDTLSSIAAIDDKVNSSATGIIKAGTEYESRIRYQEGVTYNNFIVKPQLEFGNKATEYEPYVEKQLVVPTTNGICSVKSHSPTMTFNIDTAGSKLDVEYNRDTSILNTVYIGSDEMPSGYNIHINPDGSAFELPETDQTYNPESENAQSGIAVAEALEPINNQFELIETITLEEAVTEIVRSAEPNGTPYSFKDIFIKFKWVNGLEKNKVIRLVIYANGKNARVFRYISPNNNARSWIKTLYQNGQRIFILSDASTNLDFAEYDAQIPIRTFESDKPIDSITILHEVELRAGTEIEIWGVRA